MRWLLATLALPSLAWAEAAATPPAPQGPGFGDLLQMALSLVVVIAFILALTWVLGRIRGAPRHSSGSMSVIAELAVGPKERVVLVRIGDAQALVGVGATGVSSLQLLATPVTVAATEPAGSFAEKLKGMMSR
ncbi:MAG: flagellar biosynthetic protein FliO [Steroidobacteraceae bacterium]